MYIPEYFKISDDDEIFSYIEANAFGQLISNVHGRFFSSHLPFLISGDKTSLIAHTARQNPQYRELDGQEALVTLQGVHEYISPSWYSGPGVPTWNYQAVHIYGKCKVFHDPVRLKEVVETLAAKFESAFEIPWQPDYKDSMLGAIVGIEITISEIQCKYKLSQNRPVQDRKQVIERLNATGPNKMATAMERNEP
ncbi:MAG: FMN-binding negative transcriptional regulator [bacterium]|nr:FMN-binding negative transcriptional regulator [Gammaproteobacteria bacterium]